MNDKPTEPNPQSASNPDDPAAKPKPHDESPNPHAELPPRSPTDWGANLREIMTASLGAMIALLSLWMLYDLYSNHTSGTGFDEKAFGRQKDLLLVAIGLLGTVTGFYFGRAPAERQADAARESAHKAEKGEANAKNAMRAGLDEVERNVRQAGDASGGGGASKAIEAINRARAML